MGVGAASVAEIDRLNIYHATHLAMRRAILRLGERDHVLVDGLRIRVFEDEVGPYTAIVDGDARCYSIACASVVAKVVRDGLMTRLAARHPGYGWERNAGYATAEHRAAMCSLGSDRVPPTQLHHEPADPVRRRASGARARLSSSPANGRGQGVAARTSAAVTPGNVVNARTLSLAVVDRALHPARAVRVVALPPRGRSAELFVVVNRPVRM